MFYLKDHSIILHKKNIKEKSATIYILTKNYGIKKAIAEGINRPESKLLTIIQPGSIGKVLLVGEENIYKLISFLPYKIPVKIFRLYPYMYLWALKFLIFINFLEISRDFWEIITKLDKFILRFKEFTPEWYLLKIFKELGSEPNLLTCSNCYKNLLKAKSIFLYKSSLFCENCKKDGYEKIEKITYMNIRNFILKEKIFKKNLNWRKVLKKIIKNHFREIYL